MANHRKLWDAKPRGLKRKSCQPSRQISPIKILLKGVLIMAKTKQTRRMIAMALAAAVAMSSVPVVAFAEDGGTVDSVTTTTGPDTTDNGDGTSTTVSTETTTTGDAMTSNDGQPGQPVANGSTETTTTTTLTDSEGNVLNVEVTKEGSSVETTDEVDTEGKNQAPVEVPMVPNQTTTGTGITTETTTETVPNGDGTATETTTTTTTTEREVTVTTGDITTTEEQISDTGMNAVGPDNYDGKVNITAGNMVPQNLGCYDKYEVKNEETGEVLETRYYPNCARTQEEYDLLPDEIKAKYGFDENCAYGPMWVPLKEDGTFKDSSSWGYSSEKNGIWWDYIYDANAETSTSGQGIANNNWNNVDNLFVLFDKAGNRVFAYCMDAKIGTQFTVRYSVENLEEADYFKGTPEQQEEAKAHVRAVALNGYWGAEEGTGSLDNLVTGLSDALDKGFEFVFSYTEGGVTYAYDSRTEEGKAEIRDMLINNINEGDAVVATQGSFWTYGRQNNNWIGFNPYRGNSPNGMEGGGAELRMELIRAYLTSDYLMNKVAAEDAEKNTTIIDKDAFLAEDGLSITIGDRLETFEVEDKNGNKYDANDDENADNDGYNAEISFKMVVTPDPEKDDMIVTLVNSNGDTIAQARIAGKNKEGETYKTLTADENGKYTFKDLQLQENQDTTFNLNLEGVQYLEEGVYIYKATAGYNNNQTLVGVSSGEKAFDVTTTFNVKFDVDEDDHKVVSKSWRTVKMTPSEGEDPNPTPDPEDPNPTPDPEDPNHTPDPEDPGMTIEDEDVPLSNVPGEDEGMVLGAEDVADAEDEGMVLGAEDELIAATGDNNHAAAGFGGMLAALAGMFMLRKKREN